MSDPVKAVEASGAVVAADPQVVDGDSPVLTGHESTVSRLSKLPVVEQSISGASALYGKVKDSSSLVGWTLGKAESAVSKAVDVVTPVTSCLPLKTVDSLLSKSLDFVESKVPAVKLPPQEVLSSTKQFIAGKVQPAVNCACAVKDCACAVKDYGAKKLTALTGHGSHDQVEKTDHEKPASEKPELPEKTPSSEKKRNEI
ncbi:lipid storage droplets surface-binding protein 2-like [Bacillus rossius redtenbacheri]|uniref:lipid storage droplets surface-binding protein 2-like n=1 Tax=Bacillus rossius redtenbacheri TaxID=93214 RepID=UPI002FDCEBF3